MITYKCTVSYLGYGYYGWAKQINYPNTIQQTIEETLSYLLNQSINIYGSGRTDKYVHANNQVFSFQIQDEIIPVKNLIKCLNKNLTKKRIYIKSIKIVDNNFNARYSAKNKTYKYLINTNKFDLTQIDLVYQYNKPLDLKKLKTAAKLFIGTHDFLSFSTSEITDTTRTINWIKISAKDGIVCIKINGNGFLRSMVRMIVYKLIQFNNNEINQQQIIELLNHPIKGKAVNKIDACGLYLDEVNYEL